MKQGMLLLVCMLTACTSVHTAPDTLPYRVVGDPPEMEVVIVFREVRSIPTEPTPLKLRYTVPKRSIIDR